MIRHLLFLAFAPALWSAAPTVTVSAGNYDRRDAIVEFDLPAGTAASSVLLDESGRSTPVQVNGNRAAFIVKNLNKGERKTYRFGQGAVQVRAYADVTKDAVTLRALNKTAFVYHTAKTDFPAGRTDLTPIFHRAGYLHPVFSPSGALVTDDYPRNHKHHHGIWLSWSKAEFEGRVNDYWNMGDGKGLMEFVGLDDSWNGPVHAGFKSRHQHIDLTSGKAKAALNETWNVRLFAVGGNAARPYFLFDVDVVDTCATAAPVKLPEYRYGGICVRGNWAWNGKTNCLVLTSEGETDRSKGDKGNVHARWIHMGGNVNGTFSGIAGFDHPSNFGAPEPVRLNPAEPYFNFTPQQAGDLEITPGKPWVGRYRFVVADGSPDKGELERIWNDYAQPPTVEIK